MLPILPPLFSPLPRLAPPLTPRPSLPSITPVPSPPSITPVPQPLSSLGTPGVPST